MTTTVGRCLCIWSVVSRAECSLAVSRALARNTALLVELQSLAVERRRRVVRARVVRGETEQICRRRRRAEPIATCLWRRDS